MSVSQLQPCFEITDVCVKVMAVRGHETLCGFATITLNGCFVIRDLKIIQGDRSLFVAMPSRLIRDRCPRCGEKNHLRARYCNDCGQRLGDHRAPKDLDGRSKLYADICHPINRVCRALIQEAVIAEYRLECVRALEPGYVCRYDDYSNDDPPEMP